MASFFTASYVNDTLSFSLADIAKGYLKSWFLFDITMLVPDLVGVVLELGGGPVGIFRLLKVRRILRLLRFVQIMKVMKVSRFLGGFRAAQSQIQVGMCPLAVPLLCATLLLMLAAHVLGSIWFAVGDTEKGWVRAENLHTAVLGRQVSRSFLGLLNLFITCFLTCFFIFPFVNPHKSTHLANLYTGNMF